MAATVYAGQSLRQRHRIRRVLRLTNVLVCSAFVALFAFLLVSNNFDWDHFLSAAEVDRRSWIVDGTPPLWSYQLCGGVTRAGDPQAFGLSLLFIPILIFGSLLGLKILALGLSVLGFFSLRGIIELFLTRNQDRPRVIERQVATAVSLSFVFGNFFLWHLNQGHLTFAAVHLAIAVFWLTLRIWLRSFSWRIALGLLLLSQAYFSAGVYHSLVFVALPVTIAVLLLLGSALVSPKARQKLNGSLPRFGAAMGACAVGLLLAIYKIGAVLSYQLNSPRTVGANHPVESTTLAQTIFYQAVPTIDFRFAGLFRGWGPWGIWEYSAFNLNFWGMVVILVATLFAAACRRKGLFRVGAADGRLLGLALSIAVVACFFSLGDGGPSLHRALNWALSNSVRIVGRYQGLFSLALAMVAAWLCAAQRQCRRFFTGYGTLAIPSLVTLNLLTFGSGTSLDSLWVNLTYPQDQLPWMKTLVVTRPRLLGSVIHFARPGTSFMYQPILLGAAVLNCYDPLARQTVLVKDFVARKEFMEPEGSSLRVGLYPIVDPDLGSVRKNCMEKSSFTQNRIVLDADCGPGTCVNINSLNPREFSGLRFVASVGKYCLPAQ